MLTPPTSVDLRCRPAWVARFHCHCLEYHHDVDIGGEEGEEEDVVEGDDDIALGPVPPKAGGLAPTTAIQEINFITRPEKQPSLNAERASGAIPLNRYNINEATIGQLTQYT